MWRTQVKFAKTGAGAVVRIICDFRRAPGIIFYVRGKHQSFLLEKARALFPSLNSPQRCCR